MTIESVELDRGADDGGYCLREDDTVVCAPNLLLNVGSIDEVLLKHQVSEEWGDRDLLAWLHNWAKVFVLEFKLRVPVFALTVDWLHRNLLGHFPRGHNGFGLKGEIAISRRYLDREPWRMLATLLHALLHAEQEEHGKPGKRNYHNKAFQDRASKFGLIIDQYGHTQYSSVSRFNFLLWIHGIKIPEPTPPDFLKPGKSKLRRWMCPCGIRVRVAIADFRAECLRCGGNFVLTDR